MFVKKLENTGAISTCKIWKSIELEPTTPTLIRAQFRKCKCRPPGDQADQLLEQVPPRYTKVKLNLTRCSVQELGFPDGADLEEIYAKAQELKFELCPDDLAAKLRVEYLEQPKNETLKIAMRPLVAGNYQLLFTVLRTFNQLWLGVSSALPKSRYGAKCQFVFVLPDE